MGEITGISWTDHTFNPWIGCTKVSTGCAKCYAERENQRYKWNPGGWGPEAPRKRTSAANWKKPLAWDRKAKEDGVRRRVFCASLADVFDDHPSIGAEWRTDLANLIENTPHLEWLLLTKRPGSIWVKPPIADLKNIRLGVTVENQDAIWRMSHLANWHVPTFLSVEPMLGPVKLDLDGIGWVIAGCESGPGAREMDLDWVRDLRDQCQAAGVPFFLKQAFLFGWMVKLPKLDGQVWAEYPGE